MVRVSNIVILAIVIVAHWVVVHALFASQTPKMHEQNLTIAGTILEMTFIEIPQSAATLQGSSNSGTKVADIITIETATTAPHLPKNIQEEEMTKPLDNAVQTLSPEMTTAPDLQKQSQGSSSQSKPSSDSSLNSNSASSIKSRSRSIGSRANSQTATREGNDAIAQSFTPPSHQGANLGNRRPQYPELSIRRKEEGQVTLLAHVLPSGKAEYVKIFQSSGYPRLDNAALKAAEKYHYQPAVRAGKKVSYDYHFTVTFKIDRNHRR